MKHLLLLLGFISLILGAVGIFLPVLPTTPFLLLSVFCFERSSEKFHRLLLENKIFGQYIKDYREKKGITWKNKIIALTTLLVSISFSIYKVNNLHLKIFLIFVLIGVSAHIIKIKTITNK